jgi:hypothetical protein
MAKTLALARKAKLALTPEEHFLHHPREIVFMRWNIPEFIVVTFPFSRFWKERNP